MRQRAPGMGMTNQDEAFTPELPVTFCRDVWSDSEPDEEAGFRWLHALGQGHQAGLWPPPELLGTCPYTFEDSSHQALECALGCARGQSEFFTEMELATLTSYLEDEFGDVLVLRMDRRRAIRLGELPELEGDSAWGEWLLGEDKNYDLPFCVTALPDVLKALHTNFASAALRGDVDRTRLWEQIIRL